MVLLLMGCGFSNVNGSATVDPKGSDFHPSSAESSNKVHRARVSSQKKNIFFFQFFRK